ncbi:YjjG family noncanonical pyrimidine nucleotidase [Exiguobacterium alkaliphilum]|uniref:YjjG family noncanonical pyrimidine nucleotidase n=1 Tax=Exiguobacterium alkaliphilum TaxID=1428684 RepID=A0ABT2KZH4_9BACL|nr:YjjG family noncanonical pyrimidine nucleotidase [Exiguobacterium alkaliphilum]MCT4796327.1 YjjG family noncanonical pyrimidine nucleotidase [Exiguobacterium alkaliphilum]QUE86864.1 YjjG family noncanonical pyrimidine nucleotidase [Exiguobacterium alkaliphilum]
MKRYEAILFDVDDTLLDFKQSEHVALQQLLAAYNVHMTDELKQQYVTINNGLWRAFERGEVGREDVLMGRHTQLFDTLGITIDAHEVEQRYRDHLHSGVHIIDGALELVQTLSEQYPLYIVTNGVTETQFKRLEASGLLPYFQDVFVSDATGSQKPMKPFFDYVFDRVPHVAPERGLIVGDSVTADIAGGRMYGLDTCWYNPHEIAATVETTYEIQDLNELTSILSGSAVDKVGRQ